MLGNSREVLGRGGKREYTSSVEKAAIHKNGEPKTPPFPVAYDSNLEKNILDEPALAIATEPVYDASLVPQYIAWRRGTLPHCCCILCKSVNFTNWTILHKDVDWRNLDPLATILQTPWQTALTGEKIGDA